MLKRGEFGGVQAYYRPGTSDENALKEVLIAKTYRRKSIGFDVEAGEHWLDLGGNVGAFSLYAQSKGATAECYEPMPDCFAILRKNVPKFKCHNTAVSDQKEPSLTFWTSRNEDDHYRATRVPKRKNSPSVTVKNMHASALVGQKFDGIKMDIEGSEFGLLDNWLLPKAEKLCLEYHLSRDDSLPNLVKRVRVLRKHYKNVVYCPELARLVAKGTGTGRTYFDRVIWCWGLKS